MSAAKLALQVKESQYPNQSNKDTCNVYRNILHYLKTRGFKIVDTQTPIMVSADFIKYMSTHSYVDMIGENGDSIILISLVFPNGKLSKVDATLSKFVDSKLSELSGYSHINKEYMLVTSAEIKGQGIAKLHELEEFDTDNNISVMIREYTTFLVNISSTEMFRNHSIVDVGEVKNHFNEMYITANSIPKIGHKDNMVVWLGAKVGDYIRIIRPSPSSGYTVVYRRVIAN